MVSLKTVVTAFALLIGSAGSMVQKSKGSAYMLSKYEEEEQEPRVVSVLTEVIAKTSELLNHGTGAVLTGTNGGARYLRRLFLCGLGGRGKD